MCFNQQDFEIIMCIYIYIFTCKITDLLPAHTHSNIQKATARTMYLFFFFKKDKEKIIIICFSFLVLYAVKFGYLR